MSETLNAILMTSDDLFAMRPSKKVDRWLFQGELRETKVTRRNSSHTSSLSNLDYLLQFWIRKQPIPRGKVHVGDAYFRLRKDPDTNFGIDLALAYPEQAAKTSTKTSYIEGPPLLAVEVLSPYDKQKDIHEKIEEYLECGVKLVWIVDPYDQTVTVYRPAAEPTLFNRGQDLSGEPELPGFRCTVAEIFA